MAVGRNGSYPSTVAVDLSTQADFLTDRGAYPVANLDTLIPALRKIVAWAKWRCVPVVSSLNSHRPCELDRERSGPHCIDGTNGQRKLVFTLMGTSVRVEGDNTLSVPIDLFRTYQQVIFRQRTKDLLSNPKADRFLTQVSTDRFILYGVALETSVKALALGLRARNRDVVVVRDGCGFWSAMEADLALRQLEAKGVQLITVEQLLRERLPRRVRYLALNHGGNGRGNGNGHDRGDARRVQNGVFGRKGSNGRKRRATNGSRAKGRSRK